MASGSVDVMKLAKEADACSFSISPGANAVWRINKTSVGYTVPNDYIDIFAGYSSERAQIKLTSFRARFNIADPDRPDVLVEGKNAGSALSSIPAKFYATLIPKDCTKL